MEVTDLDTQLMHSIETDDFNRFKHLLEVGADPNNLYDKGLFGNITPLIEAASRNDSRYIIELLRYGADPNIVTESGTALHHALLNENSTRVIYLLLQSGANPFLKDEDDDTPYEVAVNDEFTDFTPEIELLKDTMIRKIQNKQLRRMTHKRAKTMRRLALAKSMESQQGPFSSIRYDPSLIEKVSEYM
jgi:hypothetical protein